MSTITPEAFLAQTGDDDLDEEVPVFGFSSDVMWQLPEDPLDSIADSLRQLVAISRGTDEEEKASDRLREAYDDLDAKFGSLLGLVDEVQAIVKPSTSKLANSVRDAVNKWYGVEPTPAVEEIAPEVTVPSPSPSNDEGVVEDSTDEPTEATGHPAHDADVEDWRAYALPLLTTPGLDASKLNRSQIRSLLGIEQPA